MNMYRSAPQYSAHADDITNSGIMGLANQIASSPSSNARNQAYQQSRKRAARRVPPSQRGMGKGRDKGAPGNPFTDVLKESFPTFIAAGRGIKNAMGGNHGEVMEDYDYQNHSYEEEVISDLIQQLMGGKDQLGYSDVDELYQQYPSEMQDSQKTYEAFRDEDLYDSLTNVRQRANKPTSYFPQTGGSQAQFMNPVPPAPKPSSSPNPFSNIIQRLMSGGYGGKKF